MSMKYQNTLNFINNYIKYYLIIKILIHDLYKLLQLYTLLIINLYNIINLFHIFLMLFLIINQVLK